ncbi:MAG: cytidylate kinase, partial [Candidatus Hydrothermarchaeota archaeon]
LRHVQAGMVFREMAKERGMSLQEFSKLAEKDKSFDRLVDERQKELAKQGNVVIDGRLSGWLIDADLKIWLKASLDERAKRVAKRENKDYETALKETRERERSELKRYKEIYGIDLNDLSPYDFVINTELWSAEVIVETIKNLVEKMKRGDRQWK